MLVWLSCVLGYVGQTDRNCFAGGARVILCRGLTVKESSIDAGC